MNDGILTRDATAGDLAAIRAIYNREVETGVASFDTEGWSGAAVEQWLEEHASPFCALVAVDGGGEVVGFGSLSSYKVRPGYRFTVEDTVYVRPELQRRGIGRLLLAALIERARAAGFHAVLGRIVGGNEASIGLHLASGFVEVGCEREVGFKFDRWLDVVTVELLLRD